MRLRGSRHHTLAGLLNKRHDRVNGASPVRVRTYYLRSVYCFLLYSSRDVPAWPRRDNRLLITQHLHNSATCRACASVAPLFLSLFRLHLPRTPDTPPPKIPPLPAPSSTMGGGWGAGGGRDGILLLPDGDTDTERRRELCPSSPTLRHSCTCMPTTLAPFLPYALSFLIYTALPHTFTEYSGWDDLEGFPCASLTPFCLAAAFTMYLQKNTLLRTAFNRRTLPALTPAATAAPALTPLPPPPPHRVWTSGCATTVPPRVSIT